MLLLSDALYVASVLSRIKLIYVTFYRKIGEISSTAQGMEFIEVILFSKLFKISKEKGVALVDVTLMNEEDKNSALATFKCIALTDDPV